MPDNETRDALIAVEVDLPNGRKISGRPVPWQAGRRIKALLATYWETATQQDFDAMFTAFTAASGIDEAALVAAQPDLTILELADVINRFIYLLRPARTAAQVSPNAPPPASP